MPVFAVHHLAKAGLQEHRALADRVVGGKSSLTWYPAGIRSSSLSPQEASVQPVGLVPERAKEPLAVPTCNTSHPRQDWNPGLCSPPNWGFHFLSLRDRKSRPVVTM